MKKTTVFPYMVMALCIFSFLIGGCFGSSQIAKFYTLNSLDGTEENPRGQTGKNGLSVGLGPVLFPPYMDRTQIVTREGPNQVKINEFHRWAAPVDDHVRDVLRENLATLLPRDRVVLYPWKGETPLDYRVEIHFTQFIGTPGRDATLNARWRIMGPKGEKALLSRTSAIREPLEESDYKSLMAAKSRALEDLSREIAQAIGKLSTPLN
jgi:uncharacterized lipoprotein YmbA